MIVIGERVNATRKTIKNAIESKQAAVIKKEIELQDKAGADYIDLNAGTGSGMVQQEKEDLCWLIDLALECTEKHIVLDSASAEVLKYAADYLDNRRPWMINSINGELLPESREIIALAAAHSVPIIALAMDKDGIPPNMEKRVAICEAIISEVTNRGVKEELVYFDPLVIPISTDTNQAMVTFHTIQKIKEKFPKAKTTLGLTNISHGFKNRAKINQAFLSTAICYGLHSAICDPSHKSIQQALVMGAMLAGKDKYCRSFSRAVRKGLFEE